MINTRPAKAARTTAWSNHTTSKAPEVLPARNSRRAFKSTLSQAGANGDGIDPLDLVPYHLIKPSDHEHILSKVTNDEP